MKKIGFLSYSLPFQWYDETNIAHNKIFSWMLMEIFNNQHQESTVFSDKMNFFTSKKIQQFAKVSRYDQKEIDKCDNLVIFCGPFMPFSDKNSLTYKTIDALTRYEGDCTFVTCDYLLQFNFNIKRYGSMFSDKEPDSLTKNKKWSYILHGGFDHHFRTKHQSEQILSVVEKENIYEVPLNQAGIPPLSECLPINESPSIDLLYCGARRQDRLPYFTKYFCCKESENWMVSTTQEKKFKEIPGFRAKIRGPYPGKVCQFINKSWAQLLMTDISDTKIKNTPLPTRYWEAVAASSVVFCDSDATAWWDIQSEDLNIVSDAKDLAENIARLKEDKVWRLALLSKQQNPLETTNFYKAWRMEEWL